MSLVREIAQAELARALPPMKRLRSFLATRLPYWGGGITRPAVPRGVRRRRPAVRGLLASSGRGCDGLDDGWC